LLPITTILYSPFVFIRKRSVLKSVEASLVVLFYDQSKT
jgi:hypothetical protein